MAILPLHGQFGGFDSWEEMRKDMENQGHYDPVMVGLEARTEALRAKVASYLGVGVGVAGLIVSIVSLVLCR